MVCDKVVCERWCVTKVGVKDGVWQSCVDGVWRWWLTKLCVKDGVWQSCMWKMVCDKVVCERWCVTKLYVKDGVRQSCVCERWCVTKLCVKDGVSQSCVKNGVLQSCVDGVWQSCVWKMVCYKVVCERWWLTKRGGGRRRGSDPGYRIKNKSPTQSCGEKHNLFTFPKLTTFQAAAVNSVGSACCAGPRHTLRIHHRWRGSRGQGPGCLPAETGQASPASAEVPGQQGPL